MKEFLVIGRNILLILTSILMICIILSGYITWKPPASVLTVPFRMILQISLNKLIVLLPMMIVTYALYFLCYRGHKHPTILTLTCMSVLLLCFLGAILLKLRIVYSCADRHGIDYELMLAGTDEPDYELELVHNYEEKLKVDQCKLYMDNDSPRKGTCIIYMNYGGWSVQEESMGEQIYRFCEKEGYSFLRFAIERKETQKIDTLIKNTNQILSTVLSTEQFEHVLIAGGSAGGHMALLSAFANTETLGFDVKELTIDGVIALYPCVDPGYSYDYFVSTNTKGKNVLDWIGDKLYCSLYQGSSGTLSGETKKLDEQVFGVRNSTDSFYEVTTIKNLFGEKDIPILIVQGSLDSMIAVDSVRELYQQCIAKDNTAVYLELPGTEHVFDMMATVAWNRCEEEMTGFVREVVQN